MEDPVEDTEFMGEPRQSETVAIVPGAFKPPHMGHVNMVEQYAQSADRVIVLISAPTKSGRQLPNGKEITAEDAKNIWDLHVGANPKIEVYQSSHASPINAAYEISGRSGEREMTAENMGMEPILPGSTVILGASNKDEDAGRWTGAQKYAGDDLTLIDPQQSAVAPLMRDNGEAFSATTMRELLGDISANREELKEFAGTNVDEILHILGFEALEEMVSMQAGSITMGAGATPCEKKKKRKKSKKQQENIDITLVDDVIRLIMERGISQ